MRIGKTGKSSYWAKIRRCGGQRDRNVGTTKTARLGTMRRVREGVVKIVLIASGGGTLLERSRQALCSVRNLQNERGK